MLEKENAIIDAELADYPTAKRFVAALRKNQTILCYQNQANVMAVKRLGYNDHGPVHSVIVGANALTVLKIFERRKIEFTAIRDNPGLTADDVRVIVFAAAYLHDLGNCIHRAGHEVMSVVITKPILESLLMPFYPEEQKRVAVLCDILHAVLSHDEGRTSITTEAAIIKIADGTDCTEGRSRIPYKLGDFGIHTMSARSISDVRILEGKSAPLRIEVIMKDPSGIFQIENVMMEKIKSSGMADKVEVIAKLASEPDKEMKF